MRFFSDSVLLRRPGPFSGTNASLTHYAEDFATRLDFKFGVEVERSMARTRYGYTGRGGELGDNIKYVDYWGYGMAGYLYSGNYLAYQYEGYDTNTGTPGWRSLQDSWQVSDRLNISLGVRFGQELGRRQGRGRGGLQIRTTSTRAHRLHVRCAGRQDHHFESPLRPFFRAMLTAYHDRMNPLSQFKDYIGYYFIPDDNDPATTGGTWYEWFRITPTEYTMDDNIKHPYAPVHRRDRAGAVQGRLVWGDLHQPEVGQHHRPGATGRPSIM